MSHAVIDYLPLTAQPYMFYELVHVGIFTWITEVVRMFIRFELLIIKMVRHVDWSRCSCKGSVRLDNAGMLLSDPSAV